MRFEHELWFLAAAVIGLGVLAQILFRQTRMRPRPAILFSNLPPLVGQGVTLRVRARRLQWLLRVFAMLLLVGALARPQLGRSDSVVTSKGIDIQLVVDTSGSMAAQDFGGGKTRLVHATEVMKDFVAAREFDRIGLVSFGAHAYTRCPLTLDYGLIDGILAYVQEEWERAYDLSAKRQARLIKGRPSPREADLAGTAIGDALVTALARLQSSESKSKVVVLLTDGAQNAGETAPAAAAELARELGVKVYTVGAGSNRTVPVAVYDRLGNPRTLQTKFPLDEATLEEIAEATGGTYFAARDRTSLADVYRRIDELEKSELEARDYREWDELFQPFAWFAVALLVLDALLAATVLRTIP